MNTSFAGLIVICGRSENAIETISATLNDDLFVILLMIKLKSKWHSNVQVLWLL